MESERDWMAVSETVVQILGDPCLFNLLRSSTWNKVFRIFYLENTMFPMARCAFENRRSYLTGPGGFVVGLKVFVIVIKLGLFILLLLLQRH